MAGQHPHDYPWLRYELDFCNNKPVLAVPPLPDRDLRHRLKPPPFLAISHPLRGSGQSHPRRSQDLGRLFIERPRLKSGIRQDGGSGREEFPIV